MKGLADIQSIYPLSPMQEGLLFHGLYSPDSAAYLSQSLYSLGGTVDKVAFERAWDAVILRHSALRTSFVVKAADRMLQVVFDYTEMPIAWHDWRGLSSDAQRDKLESYLDHDRRAGINFAQAPLMRLAMIRMADNEYRLLWSHHHAILDGWSCTLLLKEVAAHYTAYSEKQRLDLPEMRPYRDFIEWLKKQNAQAAAAYWKDVLQEFSVPTPLPNRGMSAREQIHTEASTRLAPETVQAMRRLVALGITVNTIMQVAWGLLLARRTGNSDVVFGATVSVRPPAIKGIEGMIGLFINTLPVRVTLSRTETVAALLRRLQQEQVRAREFSYPSLVDIQGWSDVPRGEPMFRSIVVFENYATRAFEQTYSEELRGASGSQLEVRSFRSRERDAGLFFTIVDSRHPLLRITYDGNDFTPEAVADLLTDLEQLIGRLVQDPERLVADMLSLRDEERERVVERWNETEYEYGGSRTLGELFEEQVERTADAIAVVSGGEHVSYEELNGQANRMARKLRKHGVKEESRVGICLERGVEMVVGILGVVKAGGAYVPLEPGYPVERLEWMVENSGAEAVITEERLRERLGNYRGEVVETGEEWRRGESRENGEWKVGERQGAYVIYTSGSTGKPKGVCVEQEAIVNRLKWMQRAYGLSGRDRVLQKTAFSFDVSVWEFFWPLLNGAELVMAKAGGQGDSGYLVKEIEEKEITVMHFVPSMLEAFLKEGEVERCESVRLVVVSGEAMSAELQERYYERMKGELENLYGPTEAAVDVTRWKCGKEKGRGGVPIGKPIDNIRMYVLDEEMEPVGVGIGGELYIGGVGVGRGYVRRPEMTAERFVPDGFGKKEGGRLYRTGDRARWRGDGELEYLGRLDDQVKLRGHRIELGEIETALREQEGVRQAVAVVREEEGEKQLVGYVTGEVEGSEMRRRLSQRLPGYMVPAAVVVLEEMPLTRNGKVDRKRLPKAEMKGEEYEAPRTVVEEIVGGIWEQVLKVERVGRRDQFFELGGHSLLATQVMSRVRESLRVDLAVRKLFEAPVLCEFAEAVEEGRGEEAGRKVARLEKMERGKRLALSYAQSRLWFIEQLEPGQATYNMPMAMRLKGELDVEAVEKAVVEIVRRHEVLRTRYEMEEGEPVQVIEEEVEMGVGVVDLEGLEEGRREETGKRLGEEEAERGFDLERGPMLRVKVVRMGEEEHVLLATMHHIASDGWSQGILRKEFTELYEGYRRGEEGKREELKVQYGDYAVWQRSWLKGEEMERQLGYWRKQLEGVEVLELPTDYGRPAVASHRGGVVEVRIGKETAEKVRRVSREEGVTVFMTLLAAFQVVMGRWAGQRDVAVGTDIANRNWKETEGLIGFFVNQLVMRTDVGGNPTFRELVKRVREVALGAYGHQDVPFERVVEEMQPERALNRTPLFQVKLVLQNTAQQEMRAVEGLSVRRGEGRQGGVAKFDLTMGLTEGAEGIQGVVEYSAELYRAETVSHFVDQYTRLLEEVVNCPACHVNDVSLLRPEERERVVERWNETEYEYGGSRTLGELFEEQVERTADAIAVVSGGEHVSYEELNGQANGMARKLRKHGVKEESRVGICLERSVEMVVGILGVVKAGGAYVPLEPGYPVERLEWMVENSGAEAVITEERLRERLGNCRGEVVETGEEWRRGESRENGEWKVGERQGAYVIYTSGSTGKPKGVCVEQEAIVNRLKWMQRAYGLSGRDRVLQKTAFSFDVSVWEFFWPLLNGAELVMAKAGGQGDSGYLVKEIEEKEITVMHFVPSMLEAFLKEGEVERCESVRLVVVSGEAMSAELQERYYERMKGELENLYGPTEAAVDVTRWKCGKEKGRGGVPIGKPIDNIRMYVLDEEMEPVGVGIGGELYIGGVGVGRGYVRRPEMTAERFVPDGFGKKEGGRLYRTGDRARWRGDGELEYLGRLDDQVKLRGHRIELGEIETALREQEGVRQAVAVVREEEGEKQLVGYVTGEVEGSEMRRRLSQRLPGYMVPAAVVVLEEMPLTRNGKVDRKRLPKAEMKGEEYEAPRTVVEEIVGGIWEQVLKVERVGRRDQFFELGGHSLLATQVMSRVRESLGVDLALRRLFEAPELWRFAEAVEEGRGEEAGRKVARLEKMERGKRLALSYAQSRLWFIEQLEPGQATYNMPMAMRLKGELDVEAVEKAVVEIVRRHEVLRTRYEMEEGEPVQVIEEEVEMGVGVVDLEGLEEGRREETGKRLGEEEAERGFDLERGPMLRVKVVRMGEEEHVLLATMHHIASDGWSQGILRKEFTELYEGYRRGEEGEREELKVQYGDYAVWQRSWLKGEEMERQLGYWRKQLEGVEVLELPTDYARPAVASHRGGVVEVRIGKETAEKVRRVSREEGVTVFMTLLAAFQVVMGRWAGQRDVAVGTDIANRNWKETEGLIGFFVNQLVMRTDVGGNPTFRELVKRVREVALGAYGHQDVPFERVVEEMQPERALNRTPLFQVKLVLQNTAQQEMRAVEGLSVRRGEGRQGGVAKFDLTMGLTEGVEGIQGVVEYARDLYREETVKRLAGQYVRVLEQVTADPEARVGEVELLEESERRRVVEEWNRTEQKVGRECIQEVVERQAGERPDAVAVVGGGEQISYGELNRRANRLGNYLRKKGVGIEERVGLCVERGVEMVVALLGILKAGGGYVPLEKRNPEERLRGIVEEGEIGVVVTEGEGGGWGERLRVRVDEERWEIEKESGNGEGEGSGGGNLAYTMYTSGSTGKPKGVDIEHGALMNILETMKKEPGLEEGDVMMAMTRLGFDIAGVEIYLPLMVGGRVVVRKEEEGVEWREVAREMEREGVTVVQATPSGWAGLMEEEWRGVEKIWSGGEALEWETARELKKRGGEVWNLYGPTETTIWSTSQKVGEERGAVGIGRPVGNTQVYVLDEEMEPVGEGIGGELYIGGAGVARGYTNRPAMTGERFVPDGFGKKEGGRLYRTGDRARWRGNGELEYLGRLDDQVKLRGHRIELGEIETALREQEGVKQAAAVMREQEGVKQLVGYVTGEVEGSEMRRRLSQRLPGYMVPAAVVVLEEMPLTRNGKVDRKRLPKAEMKGEEYEAPRTVVEEIVGGIWEQVLKVERVGRRDQFFELGGHSVLATQVMSRVRESLGVDLALRRLFEAPELWRFAEAVEEGRGEEAGRKVARLEKMERGKRLALSYAQSRLWFIEQLEPGQATYNMPMAMRLKGELDVEAVEKAVVEIVRRHEVLRTRYEMEEGEPVQVIEEEVEMGVGVVDLEGLEEGRREETGKRLGEEEAERGFDLERGPMLRVKVVRMGEEEHVLLATMHHIASDGWSQGILRKEFTELYEGYRRGEEGKREELKVQYGDYAVWQRSWLKGEEMERQLGYWRKQLEGVEVLELPTDYGRPAVASHRGGVVEVRIGKETAEKVRRVSREEGVTVFMTLLAAFQVVMGRWAGQRDVAVGTDIANRNWKETEGLIGFFVNQLVMRTDVGGNPTFRELVKRVREVALGAYGHQDVPFERVVEEMQPERALNRTPLFQVKLVLQNTAQQEMRAVEGLSVRRGEGRQGGVAKFDLTMGLTEGVEGIQGVMEYARDLYREETVRRLAEQYVRVLEQVTADPEARVGELSLITESQHRQFDNWNATQMPYPTHKCSHQLFEEYAAASPDAIAVVFGSEFLSYDELNRRANQLAHVFISDGAGPGDTIALALPRSIETVIGLLAIQKAGAAYLPLDMQYPIERLQFMLKDTKPVCVLGTADIAPQWLLKGRKSVLLGHPATGRSLAAASTENPATGDRSRPLFAHDPAYIIYTSGSTGQPKGVVVEHRALTNYLSWARCEVLRRDVLLPSITSISFDASIRHLLGPLVSGATVWLIPGEVLNNPSELVRAVLREPYFGLSCVPTLFKTLLTANARGAAELIGRLAYVVLGGEFVESSLVEQIHRLAPGLPIWNVYGPTETTIMATRSTPLVSGEVPAIGKPIWNTRLHVLDENLERVPPGVVAELYIAGAGLARGYLNRPGLTAERFIPDPYGPFGTRMYRTGDRVRWLANGSLQFVGRADDQVKIRGFRIEPAEIEMVLCGSLGIAQAAVIARDDQGERKLVAFVVPAVGKNIDGRTLRDQLVEILPGYMVPAAVVVLEEMPLTRNGKVDRKRLPKAEMKGEEYEAPRTVVEEIVGGIWEQVLKVERVGRRDQFFELGGHSLLATQVMSRVRESLGVDLALRRLFEAPELWRFAEAVEEGRGEEAGRKVARLEKMERGKRLALSYAQSRLWFIEQLEPGQATYNMPMAMRLKGELDVEAVEKAVVEIVRRHEVLRTRYEMEEGEPVQVIEEEVEMGVGVVDLEGLEEGRREETGKRLGEEEAERGFDLERGPMLRVKVVRMGEEEHVLLATMHHIASDGWSQGILRKEFTELYEEYRRGEEKKREELKLQYGDYAVWQRSWLKGEEMERQLGYWRKQLEGVEVLELPTDYGRPAVASHRGGVVEVRIGKETAEKVRRVSREEGVTVFMTLLAAFQVVMGRWAGQRDVAVGTDIANRNWKETEGLIGFFVNQLVMRTDVGGNPTFRELVKRVREVALGAYGHQDVPFERVVEEMQPERALNRTPLFQVKLVLQNTAQQEMRAVEGLSVRRGEGRQGGVAKFDLTMGLTEGVEGIQGVVEYARDLYREETVKRLAGQYVRVLEQVTADPEARVGEVELLEESERRRVVEEWNRTEQKVGRECIQEVVERQAGERPDAVAVVGGGEQISYGELNRRANRLGNYLRKKGVGIEERVGLCVERGVEMVVALLGILKAGGGYVPLEKRNPEERLRGIVEEGEIGVVVTEGEGGGWGERLRVRVDEERWEIEKESGNGEGEGSGGGNLAYTMYTSGSTGKPKGVDIEHGALMNILETMNKEPGLEEGDVMMAMTRLGFDIAGVEIYLPLMVGGRVVVRKEEEGVEWREVAREMEREGVTVVQATPSGWAGLMEEEWRGVEKIWSGGEALEWETARELRKRGGEVWNLYGPTETTIWSTSQKVGEERGAVGIGRPVGNTQVYVLDEEMEPVGEGIGGELYIGGAGVARGYTNRPAMTGERFVPDGFGKKEGGRLYRTGDRARWRGNGELEYLGRLDDQVKLRGHRIELGEIETALREQEGVKQAVAVMREQEGVKQLVGYVTGEVEGSEMRRRLSQRLPGYMVPAAVVVLEEMPLTRNGKVDRKRLPKAETKGEEYEAPRTVVEEIVGGIWEQVLKVERVGRRDQFFELGGHSLLATQVMSRVRESLGVDLALRRLFEAPELWRFAEAVEEGRGEEAGRKVARLEKMERGKRLALSYAQSRLWFIEQLEPGQATYNMPMAMRLKGELDVEAVEKAVVEIVRRHEVLRTRYEMEEGEPVQVIEEEVEMGVGVVDLEGLEEGRREETGKRLGEEEAERGFDLERGPMLRVKVVRMGEEEHVLLATMHHIASDGWSQGILRKEFTELYEGYRRGEEGKREELKAQYGDYAVWQRSWLKGEEMERQLGYWRKQLEGVEVLELPTDYARPAVVSHRGGVVEVRIGKETAEKVRRVSREEGVTVFMTLLAVFQVVMGRWAGQRDVAVGTDIANRNWKETEGLIGFFVNQLVMRTDVGGNPTFRELVKRVREVALGAYGHQDVPFERVVEEMQPERALNRTPLFQVKLVLQNTAQQEMRAVEGLSVRRGEGRQGGAAKFDLTMGLTEGVEGIQGVVEYARDLYREETVRRLAGQYVRVLEQVTADPEARVGEVELLEESERRRVVEEWNRTEQKVGRECIQEVVERQAGERPDAVAVVGGGEQISYGELNRRANRLGNYLRKKGVGIEERVGVCVERGVGMVVALLAILKAGGTYVPLDPDYPADRLSYMLDDAQVAVLITEQALQSKLSDASRRMILMDGDWGGIGQETSRNPKVSVKTENAAYVIYTSGSSGRPKGVMITHRNVTRLFAATDAEFDFGSDDVWTVFHSYAFDFSVWEIWGVLAWGGRAVLVSDQVRRSADEFHQVLKREQITVLNQTPSAFMQLMGIMERTDGRSPDALRYIIFGGEALDFGNLKWWYRTHGEAGPRLVNMYGITETTVHVTHHLITQEDVKSGGRTIGQRINDLQTYVLGDGMEPLPIGIPGELYVGGAGVARGYSNRPAMTAERFVPDGFGKKEGGRLYRTGDRVRWRSDGDLEYFGRLDEQVKIRGYRIELGEIETVLREQEGVRHSVVVVQGDEAGEKRLVGYVTGEPNLEEIRRKLQARLPAYMVPTIVLLKEIPLTANDKIDRKRLPRADANYSSEGVKDPRDTTELYLGEIWRSVLGVSNVGLEENFFDIGGNSLNLVALAARVGKDYGITLPLRVIYSGPTIRQVASFLRQEVALSPPSLAVPIKSSGSKLPFFCVHPAGGLVHWYLWLARELDSERPFYGIQSYGLDEGQSPIQSIESMAAKYIDDIRKAQHSGPYHVGGWSMGALVAYEIACQLTAAGEEVSFLALLDTAFNEMSDSHSEESWESRLAAATTHVVLSLLREVGIAKDEALAMQPDDRLSRYLEKMKSADRIPDDITLEQCKRYVQVFATNIIAAQDYRPKPYAGRVSLFKARTADPSGQSDGTTHTWRLLALGGVDVYEVPGTHEQLVLPPYAATLAEALRKSMDGVTETNASSLAAASTFIN